MLTRVAPWARTPTEEGLEGGVGKPDEDQHSSQPPDCRSRANSPPVLPLPFLFALIAVFLVTVMGK